MTQSKLKAAALEREKSRESTLFRGFPEIKFTRFGLAEKQRAPFKIIDTSHAMKSDVSRVKSSQSEAQN